jgi:hypothetical protein
MVLEGPWNAEKFERMPPVVIRRPSKDMVGLGRCGFWSIDRSIDTSQAQYAASWVTRFEGQVKCPGGRESKCLTEREQWGYWIAYYREIYDVVYWMDVSRDSTKKEV